MPANFNISAALTAIWNNNVEGLQAALIPQKIDINCRFIETRNNADRCRSNLLWNSKKITGTTLLACSALVLLAPPVEIGAILFYSIPGVISYFVGDKRLADKIYNRQNWTLLHFAAAAAASDVAVYLINAGADTTVKDTAEKTFLKIAGELCNQQFIEVCKATIAGRIARQPVINNEQDRANRAELQVVAANAERNQAIVERNQHVNQNLIFAKQNAGLQEENKQLRQQRDEVVMIANNLIAMR